MNHNTPLVSVIVPTYNVERYIRKCLDSLQSQTLGELEFLCIDDGSTDASGKILDKYAANDHRFRVVHQQNQGAAAARNVGLDMATGEWVAFMDPDDFYPQKDTLQIMYEMANLHNVAICGGSVLTIRSNGLKTKKKHTGEFSGYQFHQNGIISFRDYQFDYGFWRFLYKHSLIEEHHLRFPSLRMFEDPPFMCRAFAIAGSFYALKRPTYAYRDGNGWAKTNWTANKCQKARHMLMGMANVCKIAEDNNFDRLRMRRLRNLLEGPGDIFRRADVLPFIKKEYADVLNMHTPLVSIVVPVYNDEKYVGECLNSILSQTYKNIEVICVNDGSTDNSPSVLKQYAEKSDSFFNIKVVDRENGGLSAARNTGMKCATGKYIYFLDSDDLLNNEDAILKMVLLAEENRLDQLVFGCRVFSDGEDPDLRGRVKAEERYHSVFLPVANKVLSGTELFSELVDNNSFFATQQTRFYRLGCLLENKLCYPEGLLHEDNYMAPVSLRFAEKTMLVGHRFLARRIRSGSIVTAEGDKSNRFRGLWGVVQLLCSDKRLWDAPKDYRDMLRKFIHIRLAELYWLAQDSHDEELFTQKMFINSCIMNNDYIKSHKENRGFLKRMLNNFYLKRNK